MTLFYRLKRLVASDMHAFIEGLEEPDLILAQSLRDMQEELEKLEAQMHSAERHLQERAAQCDEAAKGMAECEGKIQLALSEKREDTARFFIKKQILLGKGQQALQADRQRFDETVQALKKDFAAKKAAFDEVSQKSAALMAHSQKQNPVFACAPGLKVSDVEIEHEVELEMLKRMKGATAS